MIGRDNVPEINRLALNLPATYRAPPEASALTGRAILMLGKMRKEMLGRNNRENP
jgi:hypothetical protein